MKMLTSSKIRRSSRSLVHCLAICQDCQWDAERYTTAAREATRHVRETGHRVKVEQGIVYWVAPKETAP